MTKRVRAGQLLTEKDGCRIYAISTQPGHYWNYQADFDQVTAGFNRDSVAVRVVRGQCCDEMEDTTQPHVSQVLLSREDFEMLIASYRAFQRAEHKPAPVASAPAPAPAPADDFDPFLDSEELP